ncbi:MAG TPA: MFS transporter, partial [Phycisphaerae bacterium]|nr:MFS transporter [Phycisphaerae bacterium]
MAAILIYLFPAIMDMILSAVLFMCMVSSAQKGLSASAVAGMLTTWAFVYMISSLLIGRVVTQRNSAGLIMLACAATAALSIVFSTTQHTAVLYGLLVIEGVAMATFFVPFQVFMRVVGEGRQRTINQSVGLYTFSWSMGYAAGPFIAGLMWQHLGWRMSHVTIAGSAVLVGVMTYLLGHASRPATPATRPTSGPVTNSTQRRVADYSRMPDLAWMGWVFSGLGCLAVRLIFGLFPSSAANYGIPKFEQGLTLFLLSAFQACFGLWLSRFFWWMYRPLPILMAGLLGVGSMVLFSVASTPWMFYLAAAGFGCYSGMFFFYLVFHSLVHPERSARYVSVNEATVGLMSLTGPFVGGLIADHSSLRTSYLLTAALLLVAVVTQAFIHAGYLRKQTLPCDPIAPASTVCDYAQTHTRAASTDDSQG